MDKDNNGINHEGYRDPDQTLNENKDQFTFQVLYRKGISGSDSIFDSNIFAIFKHKIGGLLIAVFALWMLLE